MYTLSNVIFLLGFWQLMASNSTDESNWNSFFERARNVNSTFMNYATQAAGVIRNTANTARNTWQESSTLKKALITGGAAAVAAPVAIIPALGVVGFTSTGVAAGSIAASMQTASTVAGSIFALCQSAGATGAVAAWTSIGVGLGSGVTVGGITATICRRRDDNRNDNNNEQPEIEEEENAEESNAEQANAEQYVSASELTDDVQRLALVS